MYLRILRQPIDDWADAILALAKGCGAPIPPTGPQCLAMVYLLGPQLDNYGRALDLDRMKERSPIRTRKETGILRRELVRCSALYVVSTNKELILVSDRSPEQYHVAERIYGRMAPIHEELSNAAAISLGDLSNLPTLETAGGRLQ